ncbi:MAG: FUSC family protein [Litorimonas sp.]
MPFDFDRQKTRDAFRLGLQSAVAASLCFIVFGLIGSDEEFLGVLSAVLIVQPSIGRTVSAGWERLLATMVGSAVGMFCLFVLPNGYGVAIALAITMFVMNFIAGFRENWRYGVVAAVALALADTSGDIELAKARAIAIGIGILIGIAVSLTVWPESAVKRGLRHRRAALRAAAERFSYALKDEEGSEKSDQARQRFHAALSNGRAVTRSAKVGEKTRLQHTFDSLESLYNSIIVIDRVDSPLSYFDKAAIERSDLIQAGQDALAALTDDETDTAEAIDAFSTAVDQAEAGLSSHDLKNDGANQAASVIFALREMEQCMSDFKDRNTSDRSGGFKSMAASSLQTVMGSS